MGSAARVMRGPVDRVLATNVARRGISPRNAPRDLWFAFIATRLAIGRPSALSFFRDLHLLPELLRPDR